MSFCKQRLRKIKHYNDIIFLLEIFLFSLKISFSSNHALIPLAEAKKNKPTKDKETLTRYVSLCLLIRKKLGFKDTCLASSLLLCHFFRKYAIDARVCFAARKLDEKVQGHCWVEVGNQEDSEGWNIIFKYPDMKGHWRKIFLMDDHSQAYWIWKKEGVKNKVLLHMDAHMDCNWIPQKDLNSIMTVDSLKGLETLLNDCGTWDLSGKTKEERIASGNFILPALQEGIVQKFYWIVPDYGWKPNKYAEEIKNAFSNFSGVTPEDIQNIKVDNYSVMFKLNSYDITCCRLDDLPVIDSKVLLDIDLDYLLENGHSCSPEKTDKPWILPKELAKRIQQKGVKTDLVTIASSVRDGFTPEKYKYLAHELAEFLEDL